MVALPTTVSAPPAGSPTGICGGFKRKTLPPDYDQSRSDPSSLPPYPRDMRIETSATWKGPLRGWSGFSLIELLLVLSVVGICFTVGLASVGEMVRRQEARGAALSWQAASAWAQTGVLWHGGAVELAYDSQNLDLTHNYQLCGGEIGGSVPAAPVSTNLGRWVNAGGVLVSFSGSLASPDGGGSLFFHTPMSVYRVVVRPESGLTARSWMAGQP